MIEEFTYALQVKQLAKRNQISSNKARKLIKEFRRCLKEALKRGEKIEIYGIADIWPSIRERVNEIFEEVYDYDRQVEDLALSFFEEGLYSDLNKAKIEVHLLLKSYLQLLIKKLKMGYSVKISGVLLIKPDRFDEESLGFLTRLSPTLEKPDQILLKVRRLYGHIDELDIGRDRMVFRVDLKESLGVPNRLRILGMEREELPFVDDSVLG